MLIRKIFFVVSYIPAGIFADSFDRRSEIDYARLKKGIDSVVVTVENDGATDSYSAPKYLENYISINEERFVPKVFYNNKGIGFINTLRFYGMLYDMQKIAAIENKSKSAGVTYEQNNNNA